MFVDEIRMRWGEIKFLRTTGEATGTSISNGPLRANMELWLDWTLRICFLSLFMDYVCCFGPSHILAANAVNSSLLYKPSTGIRHERSLVESNIILYPSKSNAMHIVLLLLHYFIPPSLHFFFFSSSESFSSKVCT